MEGGGERKESEEEERWLAATRTTRPQGENKGGRVVGKGVPQGGRTHPEVTEVEIESEGANR